MKKDISGTKNSSPKTFLSQTNKIFRFGAVFSAIMVVVSLISNLTTQAVNMLGRGQETSNAKAENKGLLPYESPSFRVISGNLLSGGIIEDALAGAGPTPGLQVPTT